MSFKRINISMPEALWQIAEKRTNELRFAGNLSAYLSTLVRLDGGVLDETIERMPGATKHRPSPAEAVLEDACKGVRKKRS